MKSPHHYSSEKYQTIQVMRGIACLAVIAFHLSMQLKKYYGIEIPGHWFDQGYAGVDLFFVISGFVIAHSTHRLTGRMDRIGSYFIKRFVRIYPLYWIILIPSIIGLLLTAPDKIPIGNPIIIFGHWLSVVLLVPDHEAVNAVSWSLSYELYFYALFSLVIIHPRFWIVLALLILLTVLGLFGFYSPTFFAFYVSPFNVEFFAGVFIWYVSGKIKPSVFLSVISILTGVLVIALFHKTVSNENYRDRVIIFGSASFFFLFGFLEMDKARLVNSPQWLSNIGDASYVLYLVHLPYMIIANKFINVLAKDPATIITLNSLLFISVIFLSLYLHTYLEKPLMNRLLSKPRVIQSAPQ